MNNTIPTITPESQPKAPHPVTQAVRSPLFLAVAILLSVSTGLSFFTSLSNGTLSVNVFDLLIMIGMWIAYANAVKTPIVKAIPANGLNMISGTIRAMRIVVLVICILFIVLGIIFVALGPIANSNLEIYDAFREGFIEGMNGKMVFTVNNEVVLDLNELIGNTTAVMYFLVGMGIVFILTAVILLVLYYFLFCKTAHRFIYSVCENVKYGTPIEKANSLSVWLMVLGIIAAFGALSDPLIQGTIAAAQIVASVLIRKNFCQ